MGPPDLEGANEALLASTPRGEVVRGAFDERETGETQRQLEVLVGASNARNMGCRNCRCQCM